MNIWYLFLSPKFIGAFLHMDLSKVFPVVSGLKYNDISRGG